MSDYFDAQEPDHDVYDVTVIHFECPTCHEVFAGIEGEHSEQDCPRCYRPDAGIHGYEDLPF